MCLSEKRKTIYGDDLLRAMATLGFEDYIDPLRLYLKKYREGFGKGAESSGMRDAGGLQGGNQSGQSMQGDMKILQQDSFPEGMICMDTQGFGKGAGSSDMRYEGGLQGGNLSGSSMQVDMKMLQQGSFPEGMSYMNPQGFSKGAGSSDMRYEGGLQGGNLSGSSMQVDMKMLQQGSFPEGMSYMNPQGFGKGAGSSDMRYGGGLQGGNLSGSSMQVDMKMLQQGSFPEGMSYMNPQGFGKGAGSSDMRYGGGLQGGNLSGSSMQVDMKGFGKGAGSSDMRYGGGLQGGNLSGSSMQVDMKMLQEDSFPQGMSYMNPQMLQEDSFIEGMIHMDTQGFGKGAESSDMRYAGGLPGGNLSGSSMQVDMKMLQQDSFPEGMSYMNPQTGFHVDDPPRAEEVPASSHGGGQESGDQSPRSDVRDQDRFFLPITSISRIMRKALPRNAKTTKGAKKAIQAFVTEFISFITSEVTDRCQTGKWKIINGDDIITAMATLGFEDYIDPLKLYLKKYREMEGSVKGAESSGKSEASGLQGGNLSGSSTQGDMKDFGKGAESSDMRDAGGVQGGNLSGSSMQEDMKMLQQDSFPEGMSYMNPQSKESIDAALEEVLAPGPLGLKPPSLESVMAELQKQGKADVPPYI